jgi:putative membrane protein insertion efficiency factor
VQWLLLKLVRGYQLLFSSLFGRSCRFHPTCSIYMSGSVRRFGAWRGLGLGLWRILRCGPWTRGGYDPVPERFPSVTCCVKDSAHTPETMKDSNK